MSEIQNTDTAAWCIDASDHCVMCGMCLPHCPTYVLERNEADSPRGRISLIKAFAASRLAPDAVLVGHLEGCLQCRRCEAVCPARVPFGRLMDTAKHILFKTRVPVLAHVPHWLGWLTASRMLRRFLLTKLYLYQRSGLRRLLRVTGILKLFRLDRMDAMLPEIRVTSLTTRTGNEIASNKQVVLFTGCITEITDRSALAASKRLLEAAGFAVAVPARQTCCGALHQHAGDAARARQFIRRNTACFSKGTAGSAPQTVISCASGCGAQLKEHEAALGIRHFDIHAFLKAQSGAPDFEPLDKTVALHTPCTMDSCLGGADAVSEMLARIPRLKVTPLPGGCCGAAGAYMLTQPHTAKRLLEHTLKPLVETGAEMLLSSNTGCAMYLRQGIARCGMNIETLHPAVLLNRQLRPVNQPALTRHR